MLMRSQRIGLKIKSIDATEGRLLPLIIIYAIPLIISTLLQTLFNAVTKRWITLRKNKMGVTF